MSGNVWRGVGLAAALVVAVSAGAPAEEATPDVPAEAPPKAAPEDAGAPQAETPRRVATAEEIRNARVPGRSVMTDDEVRTFLETFWSLETPEERIAFRKLHSLAIAQRAKEQGLIVMDLETAQAMPRAPRAADIPGATPGQAKKRHYVGRLLMTPGEREAHRRALMRPMSQEDRLAYQKRHVEFIERRAEQMGVDIEALRAGASLEEARTEKAVSSDGDASP